MSKHVEAYPLWAPSFWPWPSPRHGELRVSIKEFASDAFPMLSELLVFFFLFFSSRILFSPMSGISELLGRVAGALERLGGRLRRPRHLCAGGADLPRPAPIGFGRPRRQEPGRARQSQAEPIPLESRVNMGRGKEAAHGEVTGVAYSTTRVLVGQRGLRAWASIKDRDRKRSSQPCDRSRVLHENCLHALLRAHML